MYNTKFILEDGTELYPGYLDKDARMELKKTYEGKKEFLICGCNPSEKLYYNISSDLKIYPLHNNYVHSKLCCRFRDTSGENRRQTAYVVNDEDGEVTAYTSFDIRNFSIDEGDEPDTNFDVPDDSEDAIFIDLDKEEESKGNTTPVDKKEPELNLEGLIKAINTDCFTEKVLNRKKIDSRQKFAIYVYHRMKKVKLNRAKKTIGELTLENDGVRFIYSPCSKTIKESYNGSEKCYFVTTSPDGKEIKNYTYPKIYDRVLKKYLKTYKSQPDENTYIAGFQYIKKSKNGNSYKVIGRAHLFKTSDLGLYCGTNKQQEIYNELHKFANEGKITFWLPPEEPSIGAIIRIPAYNKRILAIFRGKKAESVIYNRDMYVPFVISSGTRLEYESLIKVLDK